MEQLLSVLGIYHPSYPAKNRISDSQFVDEFLELLSLILPNHKNLVILGDLNLHRNDTNNPLIQILSDSLEAIGIRQIVDEYTHKNGNILDVSMVEDTLCKQDICWSVGEFLSAHPYIKDQFKLLKNGVSFKKEITRNLRDMDKSYLSETEGA